MIIYEKDNRAGCHDGVLTREEARSVGERLLLKRAATGRDVAPGIGGHTLRYLERAFSGMEGVTERQFEQTMLAHFDQMDANHDGILTLAERAQEGPPERLHDKEFTLA